MQPDLYLQFAGIFLTYCAQVTAGLVLCLVLCRLSPIPAWRFRMWLSFLLLSATWGAVLVIRSMESRAGFPAHSSSLFIRELHGSYLWLVPQQWKPFLAVAAPVSLLVYLTVVAALLLMCAWRQVRLHLVLRHGRPPGAELAGLFETIRRESGAGDCDLTVVPGVVSPATAFWWKPRIILPEVCEEMGTGGSMTALLWHELTHVRRRDYLWAVACDAVCCVLFFHPAVWKARRQMRIDRELACDRAVVATHPEERADYAELLTRFSRLLLIEQPAETGIDFARNVSLLSERVHAILADNGREPGWKTVARALGSGAAVALFCVLLPALAVMLQFAPLSAETTGARTVNAQSEPSRRAHLRRAGSGSERRFNSESTLIIQETSATRLAPRWRGSTMPGSSDSAVGGVDDLTDPTPAGLAGEGGWVENPSARNPASVKGVLLGTAAVIVGGHEDRTDRAARRRLPGH